MKKHKVYSLQLWNEEELEKISVKLGTIKYVMPYGLHTGQIERITMIIAPKHPRRIPKFLRVYIGDYTKRVRVKLMGWRFAQPGYFPPPIPPNGTQPRSSYPPPPRHNYLNPGEQVYPPSPQFESGGSSGASNLVWTATATATEQPKQTPFKKCKLVWVVKKKTTNKKRALTTAKTKRNNTSKKMAWVAKEKTMADKATMTKNQDGGQMHATRKVIQKGSNTEIAPKITLFGSGVKERICIQMGDITVATVARCPLQGFSNSSCLITVNWSILTNLFAVSQARESRFDKGAVSIKIPPAQSQIQLAPNVKDKFWALHKHLPFGPGIESLLVWPVQMGFQAVEMGFQTIEEELGPTTIGQPNIGLQSEYLELGQKTEPIKEIEWAVPPQQPNSHLETPKQTKKPRKKDQSSGPMRKSQRLENKNKGPYESTVERACRLKGDYVSGVKKKERKGKPHTKPTPEYLATSDPLTAYQAEIVVNIAGIEMTAEMEAEIGNLTAQEATKEVGEGAAIQA